MATALHRIRSHRRRPARTAVVSDTVDRERPLWQQVLLLYTALFALFVFLTTVCFLSAWLAAGEAY